MSWFGRKEKIDCTEEGLTIEQAPEDRPEFKRTYSIQVTPEVHMEVEAQSASYGVRTYGQLRQRSGSAVWFSPEDPADKILDRDLLPHVQDWCRRILEIDKSFRHNQPGEFVDDSGQRWQRV